MFSQLADFLNLSKYVPHAKDTAVIAWVTEHMKPDRDNGKRDVKFTIEAKLAIETPEGREYRIFW